MLREINIEQIARIRNVNRNLLYIYSRKLDFENYELPSSLFIEFFQ